MDREQKEEGEVQVTFLDLNQHCMQFIGVKKLTLCSKACVFLIYL